MSPIGGARAFFTVQKEDMEQQVIYNFGSIPEWVTAFAALLTIAGVFFARKEYVERTRPYVDVEYETLVDEDSKTWNFLVVAINRGQYPIYSKITKALLIVGDEKYPTIVDQEVVLFPGDDKKIKIPVGNINQLGRKKIREAKYTKNIVELQVEVSSRKLKEVAYTYKTILRVQVLVEEEKPGFILLEKTFT